MLADSAASNGEPSLRARRSQCARGDSSREKLLLLNEGYEKIPINSLEYICFNKALNTCKFMCLELFLLIPYSYTIPNGNKNYYTLDMAHISNIQFTGSEYDQTRAGDIYKFCLSG